MQIYKSVEMIKKVLKKSVVLFSVFSIGSFGFCQGVSMPSMPEMPSMPSISFDGSFYKPTLPENMMGDLKMQENKSGKVENETVIKSGDDIGDLYTALQTNNSTLTANDISDLYTSGLFTDLGSLGTNPLGLNNSNYITTTKTNILLQEVLNELNELKQVQKNASPEERNDFNDNLKDSENFKQKNPSILRFKINDYDIRDSLVDVFLSRPEEDGSFLMTGDRKYVANGKSRTETFYLLFKNEKTAGASTGYKVYPSISQDYKNTNSFVYKLCQIDDLGAEKIGNLVVLKYEGFNFKADLLIDLDQ